MKHFIVTLSLVLFACAATVEDGAEATNENSAESIESAEQGLGSIDEIGMAKHLGLATRLRCALNMALPQSKTYELGHIYSETMPASPAGDAPPDVGYKPTAGIPYTRHVGNGELGGAIGSQGTQFDALGHFGYIPSPWIPDVGPLPLSSAVYYGGLTQNEVKPDPNGPLLHLGVERVPPIFTTAVILDAKDLYGSRLPAGYSISLPEVQQMIQNQGLSNRGVLPGDAVFIRTGWGEKWEDPSGPSTDYYTSGPGISVQAAEWLAGKKIVLLGLDNPFTDPATSCLVTGSCAPGPETIPGLPFSVHHTNLAIKGVHQIQNLNLTQIANDNVNVACAIVTPLRIKGAAGSPVRPIAIGKSGN